MGHDHSVIRVLLLEVGEGLLLPVPFEVGLLLVLYLAQELAASLESAYMLHGVISSQCTTALKLISSPPSLQEPAVIVTSSLVAPWT